MRTSFFAAGLKKMRNAAFTTVEMLIVVMVISILAMIVVPKYLNASNDARDSALMSDLQAMRTQIQIYKAHHMGKGPEYDEYGVLDTDNYIKRLTGKTTNSGKLDPDGEMGPYLDTWPENPFAPTATAASITFGESRSTPRDNSTGWYVSLTTGIIYPNTIKGALNLPTPGNSDASDQPYNGRG